MLASKIACPKCRAILKTNQPVPPGKNVKCPACGAAFVTGTGQFTPASAQVPVAAPAYPVGAPAPAMPPATNGSGQFTRAPASAGYASGIPPSIPAFAEPPPRPGASGKVIALVLAGCVLFLGGGIALAIICLSGDKTGGTRENNVVTADSSRNTDRANRDGSKDQSGDRNKNKSGKDKENKKDEAPRTYLAAEDQEKVNKAIDQGVAFLKKTQQASGTWPTSNKKREADHLGNFAVGFTALPGLTLLECGVKKDDPVIQKAAAFVRTHEQQHKILLTYDISLAILFLDQLGDPKDKDLIQKLALRLVAGQTITGGWTYYCPDLTEEESKALYSLLQKNQGVSTSPLDLEHVEENKLTLDEGKEVPARVKKLAVWRRDTVDNPRNRGAKESDNSNTQFAVLALWAAKKHDMPLQRTLALMVKRFRKGQDAGEGSWGYLVNGRETVIGVKHPTMTCAGLLGLAVGQGLTNEAKGKAAKSESGRNPATEDESIKKGLSVVARHVGEPHKPWEKVPLIDLYFIWSVERVAVIYNLPKINGRDWYGWGAEMLVANQTAKGSWENGQYPHQTPTINTCFALLFLKRANLAKDLTSKLQLID
jgi:hypothetical protein